MQNWWSEVALHYSLTQTIMPTLIYPIQKLGWMKLDSQRTIHKAVLVYKVAVVNGLTLDHLSFKTLLTIYSSVSNYSLRDIEGNLLATPQPHTNYMKIASAILEQFFRIVYQSSCGRLTPLEHLHLAVSISFHPASYKIQFLLTALT